MLATDSKAYVGGLTDARAGRVNEWIGLFAAAARTAANEAGRFAAQLVKLRAGTRQARLTNELREWPPESTFL